MYPFLAPCFVLTEVPFITSQRAYISICAKCCHHQHHHHRHTQHHKYTHTQNHHRYRQAEFRTRISKRETSALTNDAPLL